MLFQNHHVLFLHQPHDLFHRLDMIGQRLLPALGRIHQGDRIPGEDRGPTTAGCSQCGSSDGICSVSSTIWIWFGGSQYIQFCWA